MKKTLSEKLKNDILLISVLLAVSLILLAAVKLLSPAGGTVLVRINGERSESLPLGTDCEKLIETAEGSNLLVIKDGKASIEDADCPDRICVHAGEISRKGESITCLPHKLTVTIEGEAPAGFDAVSN
ncbi:MAG: NusG domain II-containing protein [Oscillospiraceae bacterium]|nr:NusG domain II-containing protein [Oscillospiraceae bacterium]